RRTGLGSARIAFKPAGRGPRAFAVHFLARRADPAIMGLLPRRTPRMASRLTRRRFLQTSTALAAASYFVNPAASQNANGADRIRVGIVGVAGQGGWNLDQVAGTQLAEIVALCDVDADRAAPQR